MELTHIRRYRQSADRRRPELTGGSHPGLVFHGLTRHEVVVVICYVLSLHEQVAAVPVGGDEAITPA